MNIPKAIEILQEFDRGNMPAMPPDLRDANKLGIEALKRLKSEKDTIPSSLYNPLPGETKE